MSWTDEKCSAHTEQSDDCGRILLMSPADGWFFGAVSEHAGQRRAMKLIAWGMTCDGNIVPLIWDERLRRVAIAEPDEDEQIYFREQS